METGCIYLLQFPNGKTYVGQSWNFEKRMNSYRKLECKQQHALYNAIKKYGWETIEVEILKNGLINQQEMDTCEIYYITSYCSMINENGYNLRSGGNGGGLHSEETKMKISKSRKGKCIKEQNHQFNKPLSDDVKIKLSNISKGKHYSIKTEIKKGQHLSKHTEFKNGKDSIIFKGIILATNIKNNIQIELIGYNDIKKQGFTPQAVYSCCTGKHKSHKGYTFKRVPKNI